MDEQAIQKVREVKARHEARLLRMAHVVGVGIGFRQRRGQLTDEVALVVNVDRKVSRGALSPEDVIPSEIEGIPVDVREAGQFRALSQ